MFRKFDRNAVSIPWCNESTDGDESCSKKIKVKLIELNRRYSQFDLFVLSFPKSGRTWVRAVLSKYFSKKYGLPVDLEFDNNKGYFSRPCFSHNFFDVYRYIERPVELLSQDIFLKKPLVVLIRDPRDVCASYFHHIKSRDHLWCGSAVQFALDSVYGIDRQIRFVRKLLDLYIQHPGPKLLLSYENLRQNPVASFQALLEIMDRSLVDTNLLREAIEDCDFKKMQQEEVYLSTKGGVKKWSRIGVADWDGSSNALKVRRGAIGGFYDDFGRIGGIILSLQPCVLILLWRIWRLRKDIGRPIGVKSTSEHNIG